MTEEQLKLGKVEKQSWGYSLFSIFVKIRHNFLFYRKITVLGADQIPSEVPVIIAPNHQNALMDALAIIYAQRNKQPVFLARSDIFARRMVARILFFFKILPVFRLRDGKEKLKLNEQVYQKTLQVLQNKRELVIFPEAQHIDKKHLRGLKKGVQRIAFMFEEQNNFNANLHIVPTGLYYSNYQKMRSNLLVNFGTPFCLKDYFEDYKKDKAKAINRLTKDFTERMKAQMIHVEDLDFYDQYDLCMDILDKPLLQRKKLKFTPANKFAIDRLTVERLDKLKQSKNERFDQLIQKLRNYGNFLKKHHLKDHISEKTTGFGKLMLNAFLYLSAFPFFIYGLINHATTGLIIRRFTRNIKDPQFVSSVTFGLLCFLAPLIYLLQTILVGLLCHSWLVAGVYLLLLLPSAVFFLDIKRWGAEIWMQYRYRRMRKRPETENAQKWRKEIIETLLSE